MIAVRNGQALATSNSWIERTTLSADMVFMSSPIGGETVREFVEYGPHLRALIAGVLGYNPTTAVPNEAAMCNTPVEFATNSCDWLSSAIMAGKSSLPQRLIACGHCSATVLHNVDSECIPVINIDALLYS